MCQSLTKISIGRRWLAIETHLLPFFQSGDDKNTAEQVGVTTKILRAYQKTVNITNSRIGCYKCEHTAVHDYIGSPFEWVLQRRRRECGIDEEMTSSRVNLICVVLDVTGRSSILQDN